MLGKLYFSKITLVEKINSLNNLITLLCLQLVNK